MTEQHTPEELPDDVEARGSVELPATDSGMLPAPEIDPTFAVSPADHVVSSGDQAPAPPKEDELLSPEQRHTKVLREREINRHKVAAPVKEQIDLQLREAGLA